MVRVNSSYLLNMRDTFGWDAPKIRENHSSSRLCKAKSRPFKPTVEVEVRTCIQNETSEDNTSSNRKINDKQTDEEKELSKDRRQTLINKTHLHLQRKGITHLDDLKACNQVQFLFLQENLLRRISHLRHLHQLQELYLHDNYILRIEGLSHCHHLKKLLAPRNRIGVIEGLPPNLQILDVREQFLPEGDSLVLDPQAFTKVKSSLEDLDISCNNVEDIGALSALANLKVLKAAQNNLHDLDNVCGVLSKLSNLYELDIRRNPISFRRNYHLSIIDKGSTVLKFLDGRDISHAKTSLVNFNSILKDQQKRVKMITRGKHEYEKRLDHREVFFFKGNPIQDNGNNIATSKFILGSLHNQAFQHFLHNRRQSWTQNAKEDTSNTFAQFPTVHDDNITDDSDEPKSSEESLGDTQSRSNTTV